MTLVDIYSILSLREVYTRCKLPCEYYVECTDEGKLYLCYGDINKRKSIYSIQLQEFGYTGLIFEIKQKVGFIEKWRLSDIQSGIDTIAELGLRGLPNNNPRLCN